MDETLNQKIDILTDRVHHLADLIEEFVKAHQPPEGGDERDGLVISCKAAAGILGVTSVQISRLIKSGQLRKVNEKGRRGILYNDVMSYYKARRFEKAAEKKAKN